MLDKALSAVEKYNMLSPGAAVIAAVSGGADSMAMLLFLMKIRERYSLSLTVAHVNHGLRGEEARRDENYVRSFCEKNIHIRIPRYIYPAGTCHAGYRFTINSAANKAVPIPSSALFHSFSWERK